MEDPVEAAMMLLLYQYGIQYTRPERDGSCSLDFYLTEYDLYVEVKSWSCERLHEQLRNSRKETSGILVVIGIEGVAKLSRIFKMLSTQQSIKTLTRN